MPEEVEGVEKSKQLRARFWLRVLPVLEGLEQLKRAAPVHNGRETVSVRTETVSARDPGGGDQRIFVLARGDRHTPERLGEQPGRLCVDGANAGDAGRLAGQLPGLVCICEASRSLRDAKGRPLLGPWRRAGALHLARKLQCVFPETNLGIACLTHRPHLRFSTSTNRFVS